MRTHNKKGQRISPDVLLARRKGIEEEQKHFDNLEEIIKNHYLIGVNNSTIILKETKWYNRSGGTPDLIFTDGFKLYIVEYKLNHSESSEKKAEEQLKTAGKWFSSRGIERKKLNLLVVYGDPKNKNFEVRYYNLDKQRFY